MHRLSIPTIACMIAVAVSVGCYATASGEQLGRRASFDLGCSAPLSYFKIDEQTYGVAGCNRRAIYVEQCDGPRSKLDTSCTWVLNGTVTDTSMATQSAAPGTR